MVRTLVFFVVTLCLAWAMAETDAKDKPAKRRTGTVIGEYKSRKDTHKGKSIVLEILADGEEKARTYVVVYDAKSKGPTPEVLAVLNTAKFGDRVQCDWVYLDEGGPVVAAIRVLKKSLK